jgi:lysylphosphatidylglycerol synthetase-like protein (DUF2156 family)
MRDLPFYVLAILLGLGAGLLEIRLEDLLVTALFVMVATMVLGYLRPKSAWRWTLIVGACVPLARFWAFAFRTEPASRAQLWESGLGFLTGIAGAYCGMFANKVIHELFRPDGEKRQ